MDEKDIWRNGLGGGGGEKLDIDKGHQNSVCLQNKGMVDTLGK